MKIKVTEIDYCIEKEDVEAEAKEHFNISEDEDLEDTGIFQNDFDKKCEEIIEEIVEGLPSELIVEIDDDVDDDNIEDEIADAISDKTGWLVNTYEYEKIRQSQIDFEDAIKDISLYPRDTVFQECPELGGIREYTVSNVSVNWLGDKYLVVYEAFCSQDDDLLDEIQFEKSDIGNTVFLTYEDCKIKPVFENDEITVKLTGRDYDFIAIIENKTSKDITIRITADDDIFEEIAIKANDWIGLLANEDGYQTLNALQSGKFVVCDKK